MRAARTEKDARYESGFYQAALDEAACDGLAQGAFEESKEEDAAVVEEFFPSEPLGRGSDAPGAGKAREKIDLTGKLATLTVAEGGDGCGNAASARGARCKRLEGVNGDGSTDHVFATDVRLDNEVQYRVRHAGRVKHAKLSMRQSSAARADGIAGFET